MSTGISTPPMGTKTSKPAEHKIAGLERKTSAGGSPDGRMILISRSPYSGQQGKSTMCWSLIQSI